jgi:hypothetical protein
VLNSNLGDLQAKDFKIENLNEGTRESLDTIRKSLTSKVNDLLVTQPFKPNHFWTQKNPNGPAGDFRGKSVNSLHSDGEESLGGSDIG